MRQLPRPAARRAVRIRYRSLDRQSTQADALALVASAITTSNTYEMNQIIECHEAAGRIFDDVDLARPAHARPRRTRDLPLTR